MALRARVGKHTRDGGRQCQNWADDQTTVIALLNRISIADGGTGGALKPRIIVGMVSADFHAAIIAFESKHFPSQRLGYFDPAGPMFKKLEAMGTVVAAPATVAKPPATPAPVPVPAAPARYPGPRMLTPGEIKLLTPIFGNSLDYANQIVSINDTDTGGESNSFTPGYFPNMSRLIWSWDYSGTKIEDTAIFVHEMTHVWQSGHGRNNVARAAYLYIRYKGDYEASYKYDLASSKSLNYYNMEQAAAIIEDYYLVSNNKNPSSNIGTVNKLSDYAPFVAQLKSAGAFEWPVTANPDRVRDNVGHNI